jgi:SAM-dependent methyltransferase
VDYFGDDVARQYDQSADSAPETLQPILDFLIAEAHGGPVLEFGIGTGRIALPLAARGLKVSGIDLSTAMVDVLRSKPGGNDLEVVIGNFAEVQVGRRFSLVYLVFNTIMNLTTQAAQVACFENASRHLEGGGAFVIEVMLPDLQRLPFGEIYRPSAISASHLGIDEYDIVEQGLISHHYSAEPDHAQRRSIPFRYVWPAELDLMARIAGMSFSGRWAGWKHEPFTKESTAHVSVWRKNSIG